MFEVVVVYSRDSHCVAPHLEDDRAPKDHHLPIVNWARDCDELRSGAKWRHILHIRDQIPALLRSVHRFAR